MVTYISEKRRNHHQYRQTSEVGEAFTGVYLAYENSSEKRQSITTSQIKRLPEQCYLIDDDVRWLIALISDTGMRLAEAVGLKADDLN